MQRVGGLGTGLFMPDEGQQEQYLELDVTDQGIHLPGNPLPQPDSRVLRLVETCVIRYRHGSTSCVRLCRLGGPAMRPSTSNTAGVTQMAQQLGHSPIISSRTGPSRGQTPLRSDTRRPACIPTCWPTEAGTCADQPQAGYVQCCVCVIGGAASTLLPKG